MNQQSKTLTTGRFYCIVFKGDNDDKIVLLKQARDGYESIADAMVVGGDMEPSAERTTAYFDRFEGHWCGAPVDERCDTLYVVCAIDLQLADPEHFA